MPAIRLPQDDPRRGALRKRLLSAIRREDEDDLAHAIEAGAPWTGSDDDLVSGPHTPLMWAVIQSGIGNIGNWTFGIEALAASGSPIDEPSSTGSNPLLLALEECGPGVAKLLLKLGASLDVADAAGDTPLHKAVSRVGSELVEILLAHGRPPDAFNKNDRSALALACIVENIEAIQRLAAAGYDLDRLSPKGRSALSLAIDYESPDSVKELLKLGADPEREDRDGLTPLMIASLKNWECAAEYLLDAGADPRRASSQGMSALSHPASRPGSGCGELMRRRAAELDARDIEAATAPQPPHLPKHRLGL